MSEMQMMLDELTKLRTRVGHLETRQEHPGYAASDVARLSEDNIFTGDVDIDGDLVVGGDATITGVVQAAAAWIPGVAVNLNAKLYCGYNGNEPFETDYTGSSTGHRGQTGTETGGVIYRLGKFGKAVQVAAATTNLITNPSFETNTTGWSTFGTGATFAQSTIRSMFGTNSGYYQNGGISSAGRIQATLAVSASTAYAASIWIYTPNTNSGNAYLRIDNNGGSSLGVQTENVQSDQWNRVVVNFTTPSDVTSVFFRVYAGGVSNKYFVDGIQLEQKAYATPYCDGSLGTGHSWSGTTHASTSSRTAGSAYYTNPLSATAGTLGIWWQPAAAASVLPDALLWSEGNLRCWFDTAANTLKFSDGTNTVTTAAQTFTAGDWLHVACVYSSSGLVLYKNGVSAASGGTYTAPTLGASLYVGCDTAGANQCNGLVDDLAILTRAASADEIRAIYESQCQLICS